MSDTTGNEAAPPESVETGDAVHIHKPKAAHSLREFLAEISVIVVGILIALSGEQTIEATSPGSSTMRARSAARASGKRGAEMARSMKLSPPVFAVAALSFALTARAALAANCAPEGADPTDTVRRLYAAVTRGDSSAAKRLFAPGLYAFDQGERMSAAELGAQIDQAEKAKLPYTWTVEQAEAHVACDTAWVTYTNRHVPLPGAKAEPKAYLESVVLVWREGDWKLQFFHSTPAKVP